MTGEPANELSLCLTSQTLSHAPSHSPSRFHTGVLWSMMQVLTTSHQCQIPLFQPLLLLLLILIRIWIVVLLRSIGDQKLCYGFMLEIIGHDGIQESALTLPLCYISGSPEKSGQGSCGASTLRGGHCHNL